MHINGENIGLPEWLPIMTLSETVFFPKSVIQLHIFENRYQQMLSDTLSGNRIFVIANQKETEDSTKEIPHKIATAGIIRLSRRNQDGTSDVILQGLYRVSIDKIIQEVPYRRASTSSPFPPKMFSPVAFAQKQKVFIQLLKEREMLGVEFPQEAKSVFENLKNLDAISDLATHAFCSVPTIRQKILETPSPETRMQLLVAFMHEEISALRQQNQDFPSSPSSQDLPLN